MSTQNLQNILWASKHSDFRGVFQGERCVLVNSPSGTCLAPLSKMTALELLDHICPAMPRVYWDSEGTAGSKLAAVYLDAESYLSRDLPTDLHVRMAIVYRYLLTEKVKSLSKPVLYAVANSIRSHVAAEAGLSDKTFTTMFHKQ